MVEISPCPSQHRIATDQASDTVRDRCLVLRRGITDYEEAWDLQRRLADALRERRSPPALILLQHPPTYTLGVQGKDAHVLLDEAGLRRIGASLHRVDRGGDATFHGPGQLVGYPILDLRRWGQGPLWYVRALEATLIEALARLEIAAERVPGRVGVWAGRDKIAAIGLRVSRGVTTHGFALNVATDLSYYRHIVPCGLVDAGVTSVERILGRPVAVEKVADLVVDCFAERFGLEMIDSAWAPAEVVRP
jgi:lipoyl(octanoyl) transferase